MEPPRLKEITKQRYDQSVNPTESLEEKLKNLNEEELIYFKLLSAEEKKTVHKDILEVLKI